MSEALFTHIWFSSKISAICSFSHSTSFRAEKANSSASAAAICSADVRSSCIHDVDPTCSRDVARIMAIAANQNNNASSLRGSEIVSV